MLDLLRQNIREKDQMAIMLSGGLDSGLLAMIAQEVLGEKALAITIESPIVPWVDIEDAISVAQQIGIRHEVVPLNELEDKEFSLNSPHRCYICRKLRDRAVRSIATTFGFELIADGIHYGDLQDFRPGIRAANEDGIYHPFAELGITKENIRDLARDLGIDFWEKHSDACLCSRIAYGVSVDTAILEMIDKAEQLIRGICTGPVRVRYFPHGVAFIETYDFENAFKAREQISGSLKEMGFSFVCLDLEGFSSGKMNRIIN